MAKLFLAVFTVSLLFGTGYALKCYQCTYNSVITTTGCKDGALSDSNLKECPSTSNSCSKGSGSVAGTSSVIRSCSTLTKDTCETTSALGVSTTSCYCKTDACNSSSRMLPSLTALLVMSIMAAWCFA